MHRCMRSPARTLSSQCITCCTLGPPWVNGASRKNQAMRTRLIIVISERSTKPSAYTHGPRLGLHRLSTRRDLKRQLLVAATK